MFPCLEDLAISTIRANAVQRVQKLFDQYNPKFPEMICGKIFGFKCELKKHLDTHTREKTFVCS